MKKSDIKKIRKMMQNERKQMQEMLVKYHAAKSVNHKQEDDILLEHDNAELSPKNFFEVMEKDSMNPLNSNTEEKKQKNRYGSEYYDLKNKIICLKANIKQENQERRKLKNEISKVKADTKDISKRVDKLVELMAYYMYLSCDTQIGFDLSLNKQHKLVKKQAEKKLKLTQKDTSKYIDVKWKEL